MLATKQNSQNDVVVARYDGTRFYTRYNSEDFVAGPEVVGVEGMDILPLGNGELLLTYTVAGILFDTTSPDEGESWV